MTLEGKHFVKATAMQLIKMNMFLVKPVTLWYSLAKKSSVSRLVQIMTVKQTQGR